MDLKKVFIDVETTGTDPRKHSIHQIAGFIEIGHEIVDEFDYQVAPHPKCQIDPKALRICDVTEDQIRGFTPMKEIHAMFTKLLGKYIDRYKKTDKAWIVGYNNRSFDDEFMRRWFEQCGDEFMGAWFWSDSLDVLVLASQYLLERRRKMPSFQLYRVAQELGLEIDEKWLHNAYYDITLTRQIYQIVTGLEIE